MISSYPLQVCNLIYIEEVKNENPVEHIKENVKCWVGDVFGNKYYNALNRDVELVSVLKIREHETQNFQNGQLRYVQIDNKKFVVDKISYIKGRFALLDLAELL